MLDDVGRGSQVSPGSKGKAGASRLVKDLHDRQIADARSSICIPYRLSPDFSVSPCLPTAITPRVPHEWLFPSGEPFSCLSGALNRECIRGLYKCAPIIGGFGGISRSDKKNLGWCRQPTCRRRENGERSGNYKVACLLSPSFLPLIRRENHI